MEEIRENDIKCIFKKFNISENVVGMMSISLQKNYISSRLTRKMEDLKTFEDLTTFLNDIVDFNLNFGLYSKRRKTFIKELKKDDELRFTYVYEDNDRIGSTNLENLYKYFEIRSKQ